MSNPGTILGISNIFMGVLLILVSIPLYRCSIGPNSAYGFRIAKAFASEELWYKINKYGALKLMIWSIPLILFGIVTLFIPDNPNAKWLPMLLTFAPYLLLIIPIVQTLNYAKKL